MRYLIAILLLIGCASPEQPELKYKCPVGNNNFKAVNEFIMNETTPAPDSCVMLGIVSYSNGELSVPTYLFINESKILVEVKILDPCTPDSVTIR